MPVKDNSLLSQYIRNIENPDSLGYRKGRWYASPYDANARGFGVDVVKNDKARKVAEGRIGKWLSEKEERDIRNDYIEKLQGTIDRRHLIGARAIPLSDRKRMVATGLLYRGDGINSDRKLSDAYYRGTDSEFEAAVKDYYIRKGLPERARLHDKFLKEHPQQETSFLDNFTWGKEPFQPNQKDYGGTLEKSKVWDDLSLPDKSEMMKVAIRNGITDLPTIRQKYSEFAGGGYMPSEQAKQRIARWEGAAMTGAIDPLSGKWAKNNSFENEAKGFTAALPESIREQVLSNPELADSLYSYSYNVGAGNFKKRVVPALEKYYAGQASAQDVANSLWASGDSKLRGLQLRRAEEKAGVMRGLSNFAQTPTIENRQELPAFMPMYPTVLNGFFGSYQVPEETIPYENPLVKAAELEAQRSAEIKRQEFADRRNRLDAFSTMLGMIYPEGFAEGGNLYGDGGKTPYKTTGGAGYIPSNYGWGLVDFLRRRGVMSESAEEKRQSEAQKKARDLSRQTKKIPATYIGGTPTETRREYWRQEPVMQHAVDSIAGEYGISPDLLKHRLNHEGFVDNQIRSRNFDIGQGREPVRGYDLLNFPIIQDNSRAGFTDFGLDDVKTYIDEGKVNLINEQWEDGIGENEKGRPVNFVTGITLKDNLGITAATLKYFKDVVKSDYPNLSDSELDRYANAYYNRGIAGGRKWAKSGAKGYSIK